MTYIFEPLFDVKPFGHPVDYANTWNTSVRAFVNGYINKLFNCDNVIQKKLAFFDDVKNRPFFQNTLAKLPFKHVDKHKNM